MPPDESDTRFEVPQRILGKLNFPQQPNPHVVNYENQLRMSQEEKDQILISKNRELLQRKL